MNENLIIEVCERAGDTDAVLYGSGMSGTPIYIIGYDGKLNPTQWQGQDMDNAIAWAQKDMCGCYVIHPSDELFEDVEYYSNREP